MSLLQALLACDAALLALSVAAASAARRRGAGSFVYGAALALSVAMLAAAAVALIGRAAPVGLKLPIGLPWIGANFRLDALSAFFALVVNLGGAAASLYGIGYGRREHEPARVLPFFPAFLAGMNLVLIADDAYTFLVSWEFMSLASWALVMAHHREAGNQRAGFVYIVMATFGALSLLLAFGLLAGASGGYAFDVMRAATPSAGVAGLALALALIGAGSKAGLAPLHVWLPLAHPAAPASPLALKASARPIATKIRPMFSIVE